jgi:hypothetical protein
MPGGAAYQGWMRGDGGQPIGLCRLAAVALACCAATGGCDPAARGRWERAAVAPGSVRGLQELEAVRADGKVVIVGGVDYTRPG